MVSVCLPSDALLQHNYFTILYWFCHTSTWICHRYTRVPHPEPPSLLPPGTIPLGHLSAPAPSIQYHALNLDCWLISYMILYMFQCYSPKSSHPRPLPQSPKDCSIHLCLFCCLAYRGRGVLKVICQFWDIEMKVIFPLNSDSVEFVIWQEKGNALWKVKVKSLSGVQFLSTPWTVAHQDLPSTGFSRQECWSSVPLPSPNTVC